MHIAIVVSTLSGALTLNFHSKGCFIGRVLTTYVAITAPIIRNIQSRQQQIGDLYKNLVSTCAINEPRTKLGCEYSAPVCNQAEAVHAPIAHVVGEALHCIRVQTCDTLCRTSNPKSETLRSAFSLKTPNTVGNLCSLNSKPYTLN